MPINSFLYPGAKVPPAYEVANSLRFNGADSARLSIANPTAGNRKTGSISFWIKFCDLNANHNIYNTYNSSASGYSSAFIQVTTAGRIEIINYQASGGSHSHLGTNRLLRDFSSWYHCLLTWDTTQSTSSNRMKIYINGTEETSFSTAVYPSLNEDLFFDIGGTSNPRYIGFAFSAYMDAYLTEMVYVNGSALTPTSFGEFDEDSPNIWKPIDVSGLTFGDEGFYLDFEDSSDLGKDISGNSNNFTSTNITSTDQSTDTCTNNFATLNPLYHYSGGASFSEGNLKFTTSGNSSVGRGMSTIRPESGKWYVECKITDVTRFQMGIMNGNETNNTQGGTDSNSVILGYGGGLYFNGSLYSSYTSSLSNNDIVQLALDLDNDLFWFGVNDTWGNSATRTEIENGTATNSGSTDISSQVPVNTGAIGIFLEDNSGTGNNVAEINFGSPSFSISSGNSDANGYGNFEYAVPSGYYALNSKNLAEFG